jgi:methyl-accepting chemotaxis protein
MSELNVIENIQAERTDLALHVDLCAQRYNQLILKFDEVDRRLDQLTEMVVEIKHGVSQITTSAQSTYLKWSGFVIVTLLGIVIHYAVK